ncbi:Na/Pi cotransporter [Clostridium tetani]|uniref:Sodium-dependent phosphate transport protein n=1 Tax=Clostridium tetani (strain Massachusetts / E88) TaxID=212717 RepID=Q896W9_CLOTE|nr:Na/Pi cotransporter family protein [Clostridium tetani]AAO35471.1 sodium-dependent phosphate transport protein [Clostridium tetani E88]AVP55111.1 Na/Pi cotransporter family protein [Clostridium tetani]KGI37134.1 sodium-dependent phosphate transporter [Clostridium tetani]KGI40524.1 sodium-dependent phosphate transporter [Clostridium tetani ATCC 9441]KGI42296.1 sodium-dependent phosphate transporter [Clostridium tetani]
MDIWSMLVGLFGGLGLFLYGMKIMGDGLENVAGDKLKGFFEKIASNPIKAVLTGVVVTAVIQSSSATTVMVIGFVNAGLMNLFQATGVIMGANIGTTVTGQLVALNLTGIAPIFIGVGAIMLLFSKGNKIKDIGSIVLGFGMLFLGMKTMSSSMAPLADSEGFKSVIATLAFNPILGVLVGIGLTAIVQSSSATIGILIVLANNGALPVHVALPVLFGDNIGTCVTALLSSVGTNRNARRAATIHLTFNIIGTVIFVLLLTPVSNLVGYITPGDVGKQIANAHTFFNIANVIIQIPFIKYLVAFVNKVIPQEEEEEVLGIKYIDDRLLETPVIAVGQCSKEIVRMAEKSKEILEQAVESLHTGDEELIKKAMEGEDFVDLLEEEITKYLVKLSNTQISTKEIDVVTSMFRVVKDIERIGDHGKNIADLSSEKISKRLIFSEAAMKELSEIYKCVILALEKTILSFQNNDIELASEVYVLEDKIDELQDKSRDNDIKRLNSQACEARVSAIYLDIISNFERVGDHSLNIAEVVLNLNNNLKKIEEASMGR